jgi:alpha-N-arabinofuranosidase
MICLQQPEHFRGTRGDAAFLLGRIDLIADVWTRRGPLRNVPALSGTASLAAISCSASVRDKRLTVTLTNPSLNASLPARIRLTGGTSAIEARGLVLTHQDMRATNTFAKPEEVKPVMHPVKVAGDTIELSLPKQSISLIDCRIA